MTKKKITTKPIQSCVSVFELCVCQCVCMHHVPMDDDVYMLMCVFYCVPKNCAPNANTNTNMYTHAHMHQICKSNNKPKLKIKPFHTYNTLYMY